MSLHGGWKTKNACTELKLGKKLLPDSIRGTTSRNWQPGTYLDDDLPRVREAAEAGAPSVVTAMPRYRGIYRMALLSSSG